MTEVNNIQAEESKKQFIGKKSVIAIVETDIKTPLGSEIIEVRFGDGTLELMPKKTFNIVVTDTESDDTKVAKEKYSHMVKDILAIIAEYDMKLFELEYLVTSIKNSILDNINRANNILWRGDDAKHIAGFDMLNDVSLIEVQKVLNGKSDKTK